MIPKIIHQVWVGEYDIPDKEKQMSENIKNNHPDYTYYLWTNQNMPSIPDNLKEMYDMYSKRILFTVQDD